MLRSPLRVTTYFWHNPTSTVCVVGLESGYAIVRTSVEEGTSGAEGGDVVALTTVWAMFKYGDGVVMGAVGIGEIIVGLIAGVETGGGGVM
jgi:hypothetical protein